MKAPHPTVPVSKKDEFQTNRVLFVTAAHFVNDTYPAFLAPLIPLLNQSLGISLTLAGSLVLFLRVGGLIQPLIGYLADRTEVRYFVIYSPAITAILMSCLGLAPSYVMMVPILFFAGVSGAMFHAPAPSLITHISGEQWGKGMSYFMAGGELGRSVGPVFIVWIVERMGLQNAYLAAIPGVLATLVLYRRVGALQLNVKKQNLSLRVALKEQGGPLLLLLGIPHILKLVR